MKNIFLLFLILANTGIYAFDTLKTNKYIELLQEKNNAQAIIYTAGVIDATRGKNNYCLNPKVNLDDITFNLISCSIFKKKSRPLAPNFIQDCLVMLYPCKKGNK